MSRFMTALLAGSALLASVGAANAATISGGTASITNTLTDYNTQLGTLSLFDSTLGTLRSITFTAGFGFTSTITVNATTESTGDIATVSAAQFSASDSAINAVINSLVNTISRANVGAANLSPASYRVTGDDNSYDVAPGTQQTFSSNVADSTKFANSSQAGNLTPFIAAGGGSFAVFARTLTGTTGTTTGGNASITQATYADQSLSITYTYDAPVSPVPEPASMAILGAGLLGAGLLRRRAK